MRSDTRLIWNAPAAMNRIKSVLTMPYLVPTVQPSTMGSMSRCTPSRETSGPLPFSLPAILSISSMNIMPSCSARRSASAFTLSVSIMLSDSSATISARASLTVTFRFLRRLPNIPPNMPPISISAPEPGTTSMGLGISDTSISTSRLSYFPAARFAATSSRSTASALSVFAFFSSANISAVSFFSASFSAFSDTPARFSSLTSLTEVSTRSRTIDSTSLPT